MASADDGRGPTLTILGRQGSGKGTQAMRLVERLGIVHLSTGDLLRHAVARETPLGKRVARDLDAGRLVADDVMLDVVDDRLVDPEVRQLGFVLDGYPRTAEQLDDLLRLLGAGGLDAAILLDVPLDVVRERIDARRVCTVCGATTVALHGEEEVVCTACGGTAVRRPDDTPDAIDRRLATYEAETEPLLRDLRAAGLLVVVDAVGSPDEVFERLLVALRPVVPTAGHAVT